MGRLDHWDVMNELLHGQWFEHQTNDPEYTEMLFKEVHRLDPKAKLFLNDYAVISGPEVTDVSSGREREGGGRGGC